MVSFPVVMVVNGDDALHDLYIACVTRITLWNLALYSKTDHTNYQFLVLSSEYFDKVVLFC